MKTSLAVVVILVAGFVTATAPAHAGTPGIVQYDGGGNYKVHYHVYDAASGRTTFKTMVVYANSTSEARHACQESEKDATVDDVEKI